MHTGQLTGANWKLVTVPGLSNGSLRMLKMLEYNPVIHMFGSYLYAVGQFEEDVIDLVLKPSTKHLVSLVQHKHFDGLGS